MCFCRDGSVCCARRQPRGSCIGEVEANSKWSMTKGQNSERRAESRLRPQRLNDSGFRDCFRAMPRSHAVAATTLFVGKHTGAGLCTRQHVEHAKPIVI